jgi:hypothetical protein
MSTFLVNPFSYFWITYIPMHPIQSIGCIKLSTKCFQRKLYQELKGCVDCVIERTSNEILLREGSKVGSPYWMHQTINEMFSKKVVPRTERVCWYWNFETSKGRQIDAFMEGSKRVSAVPTLQLSYSFTDVP